MTTTVKFDGAARGNPGPAAIGYVVESEDWTETEQEYIGRATNNVAEWTAVLRGVEEALDRGCTSVRAVGDSEVVVKQMQGEYDVNDQKLIPLYDETKKVVAEFDQFEIDWVSREGNTRTDELANEALDERDETHGTFVFSSD